MRKLLICILALATAGFTQTTKKIDGKAATERTEAASANRPTEQTVDSFMRHTFGYDQNLKWTVAEIKPGPDPALTEVTVVVNTPQGQQNLKLYVTPDQKFAINGDLVPFGADPFAANRAKLAKEATGPWRGAANPDLVIVEFGDLQCPVCKRAQPIIEKLMTDEPNAKLIFQEFPLGQIHQWADLAAKYSLCVAQQSREAFWKYIDIVYQHQEEMEPMKEEQVAPKLKEYVTEAGMNADKAEQCTKSPDIAVKINDSIVLGREMDVTGTPTLFIGGRKIGNVVGIPYETLKEITDFQASHK